MSALTEHERVAARAMLEFCTSICSFDTHALFFQYRILCAMLRVVGCNARVDVGGD